MADEGPPELYDEALLLEAEKFNEATACADEQRLNSSSEPVVSSFSSHWSSSWSKPPESRRNTLEPQLPLLPEDNSSDKAAMKPAEVTVELSPCSSLSKNSDRVITGSGLENLGNTCFLNSVLQCFIHTVTLIQPILSNEYTDNCNKEGFCLLCTLRQLIQGSLGSNTTFSPCNLVNNLTHISSNFQRFQQEDAHEFLQCFLDKLEGCHKPESKSCISSQRDNIVQQVFGGRLVSNLKCCNCGHCSDTYEHSIDLSLEIDDVDNLFAALHSFTKVERIGDPDTKVTCEKCNELVDVEKKLSFDQAPSVAVLHLKRFKNDGSSVEKIDKHVAFPLYLDLEPFTGTGRHNYSELQYALYAVVVHIGSPTCGHYYCFIRLSRDMWCKFDDSKVELVREDYVLSQEAYILFYAKDSTPWFSSFIETQKEIVNSSLWNTSPKSVLDNTDTSTVSPNLVKAYGCNSNKVSYDFGAANEGGTRNKIKDSEPVQRKNKGDAIIIDLQCSVAPVSRDSSNMPSNMSLPKDQNVSPLHENVFHKHEASGLHKGNATVVDLQGSVAPVSRDSSNMSLPKERKITSILRKRVSHKQEASVLHKGNATVVDLQGSVAPVSRDSSNISLAKDRKSSQMSHEKVFHKQEASVLQNYQIDIDRAFRSPSPEIYREDSPVAGFTISRRRQRKSVDNVGCKRRLVKEDKDDEMKQARSFVMKNIPSSRAQQLMAALRGSQSEPPVNRKKARRLIA